MVYSRLLALIFLLCTSPLFAGVSLKASGSYLSGGIFSQWIEQWHRLHPEIKIKYEPKDSTQGGSQFLGRGVDLAATDIPLSSKELERAKGRSLIQLPAAIQAVGITYNLPGVSNGLRLTPEVLSQIFRGSVKKWNDPAIAQLNPKIDLPDMEIRVLHRQEESSLHDLFPGFLARLDSEWTLKREKEKNLHWSTGEGVKGNEKVYAKLRLWPGVIAAVDYPFAMQKKLPLAAIQNQAGFFVGPSEESLRAGAQVDQGPPENLTLDLTLSQSPKAYPLCSFVYLMVYQDYYRAYHDHKRGEALADFLVWVLSDGQHFNSGSYYVPLPETFRNQVAQSAGALKF
jgi:phosphate transport system substrate-binding protein